MPGTVVGAEHAVNKGGSPSSWGLPSREETSTKQTKKPTQVPVLWDTAGQSVTEETGTSSKGRRTRGAWAVRGEGGGAMTGLT